MNERVTIQSPTTASDSRGGQTVSWSTAYSLWANVKSVRGAEVERLGRLISLETYLVTLRYGPSISTTYRLVWGGKTMNIRSVQDRGDAKRQFLTLECEVDHG